MRSVLRALPNRAALLLVGDVDQLPSVGPPRGRGPPEQFAADSPLEGTGFELPVRGCGQSDCRSSLRIVCSACSMRQVASTAHPPGIGLSATAIVSR